jgi:xanthine dehydrogenase accessory factor
MKEMFETIVQLFERGRSAVLATIIRQAGPSPRGTGTRCLIMDDGSFVGTIGGGILEARTLEKAGEIFDEGLPDRLYFSLEGTDVAETDMQPPVIRFNHSDSLSVNDKQATISGVVKVIKLKLFGM